jgi:hypothetical protein
MKIIVRLLVLFVSLAAMQCGVLAEKKAAITKALLEGSWKVDSAVSYDNGYSFTYRDLDEEPLQHYQPDGRLRMTRDTEFRFFYYDVPAADSLVHRTLENKLIGKFQIVRLDQTQLVLRKEKAPIFSGKNQKRYELRYFSRIKE